MSRIWKVCLTALVASGLLVAGCDDKAGDETETEEQAEEKSEAEEPEEADEGSEEAEAEYSQSDYVEASVALSCIDSELPEDEIEDRDKVESDVLGKYGFDQDSYEKAESEFSDDEEAQSAIEAQLEECNEEQARKHAGLAAKEEKGEEKKEEKAKPTPAVVGSISATKENASGFGRAELSVKVNNDFSATGKFEGVREDKGFRIPLEGKVTKDNKLNLSGSKGKNEVKVDGNLKKGGSTANVSGSIWQNEFNMGFTLK